MHRAEEEVHIAAALDGAGWHSAAWREDDAEVTRLLEPRYWVDLVGRCEDGLLDLVTLEDSLAVQSTHWGAHDERTDQVRGRLDAVLVAARTEAEVGRTDPPLVVLGELLVVLDDTVSAAQTRLAWMNEQAGAPLRSDAAVYAGTPSGLADLLDQRADAGLAGFRLRPSAIPHDLDAITRSPVPELQRRGLFRTSYTETTLRERFGLQRPESRYAS